MLRFVIADLHVHTVLSPCAEAEMLPELILRQAQELNLGVIAVTDHNSAENAVAVVNAAAGTGVTVLPGMEVQTREEVHMLCLFDTLDQVARWQADVYAHLPPLRNEAEVFGCQVVLDPAGEPAGYNERLLLTSTSLTVEDVVERVRDLGGMCIPAHVDRPAYSLIANLGFIPPDLDVPAAEISARTTLPQARERFPQLATWSLVGNGDAHRLHDMARRTTFKVAAPTVAELSLALAGRDERGTWIDGLGSVSPGRGEGAR